MKNKKKILALIILCLLVFLCFLIGNTDKKEGAGEIVYPDPTICHTLTPTQEALKTPVNTPTLKPESTQALTLIPSMSEAPKTTEDVKEEKKEETVSILIECKTILNNIEKLKESKKEIIPQNGVILSQITVEFIEGESAFDLLLRISKEKKIHLEFTSTPVYNSVYVEGIANLYEFDCGDKSGWTYKVNGEKLNYGASDCILKPGDKVEWLYTCDMGRDV